MEINGLKRNPPRIPDCLPVGVTYGVTSDGKEAAPPKAQEILARAPIGPRGIQRLMLAFV